MTFDEWWKKINEDDIQFSLSSPRILCEDTWNSRQPEIDALTKVNETAQKGWNECSVKVTELTASLAKMKEKSKYLSEMLSVTFKELKNWTKEYGSKSDFEKISETAEKVYEIIAIELPEPVKDEICDECRGKGTYKSISYQGPPDNVDGTFDCETCHGTGRKAK